MQYAAYVCTKKWFGRVLVILSTARFRELNQGLSRRVGLSFVLTIAKVVDGDTVNLTMP